MISFRLIYLTKRKQYISLNDSSSEAQTLACGVPQGSVLGPLLFLFSITVISNATRIFKCVLFVDDTNIFYSGGTVENVDVIINKCFESLKELFNVNTLCLNIVIDKTNRLLLYPS